MELSPEDSLRLNVLLANRPLAIRIDEAKALVWGLSEQGEVRIPLNPIGRPEAYVRKVRELLSGQVLGSPGGYPLYLRRWTRMGQMRDESLAQLLLLGEPEAVVAAVCSPGLTDELARRAWWAMEDVENARRMLQHPAVVSGRMGPLLAGYLLDYLPFETEPEPMIETIRLVLQPGLIGEDLRRELWQKGARRQAYLVGFLLADPDGLPRSVPARPDAPRHEVELATLAGAGNAHAALLRKVLSAPGQAFLATVEQVLHKPPTQEVVTSIFGVLRDYFHLLRPAGDPDCPIQVLLSEARGFGARDGLDGTSRACLAAVPALEPELRAMGVLSGLGYGVLRPVLSSATLVGSLMRKKLEPVLGPILDQLAVLRGRSRT